MAPGLVIAFAAAAAISAPGAAWAGSLFGSAAIFTDRSCATNAVSCVDPITGIGPKLTPHKFLGGGGGGVSGSANLPGGASTAAMAAFGASFLPTIGSASSAGANTRTGASVSAYRSFTYNGPTSINFALSGALHFLTSGDAAGPAPYNEYAGDGMFNVALSLLRVSDVFAELGANPDAIDIISSNVVFEDCASGAIAATGYSSSGLAAGEYNAALSLTQSCSGGAIVLNPGDSFVVMASVQAISNRNGFVDAMHTFTVQYDDMNTVDAVTHQSVGAGFLARNVTDGAAVPEPASWALMLLGFGGLGAALRTQRRRQTRPA